MKYEIPWCPVCRDWHMAGTHTRSIPTSDTGAYGGPVDGGPIFTRADPKLEAALRVLGLGPGPTKKEARAAFRDAISQAHPDHGGTGDDAKRVLAARDELRRRGIL